MHTIGEIIVYVTIGADENDDDDDDTFKDFDDDDTFKDDEGTIDSGDNDHNADSVGHGLNDNNRDGDDQDFDFIAEAVGGGSGDGDGDDEISINSQQTAEKTWHVRGSSKSSSREHLINAMSIRVRDSDSAAQMTASLPRTNTHEDFDYGKERNRNSSELDTISRVNSLERRTTRGLRDEGAEASMKSIASDRSSRSASSQKSSRRNQLKSNDKISRYMDDML